MNDEQLEPQPQTSGTREAVIATYNALIIEFDTARDTEDVRRQLLGSPETVETLNLLAPYATVLIKRACERQYLMTLCKLCDKAAGRVWGTMVPNCTIPQVVSLTLNDGRSELAGFIDAAFQARKDDVEELVLIRNKHLAHLDLDRNVTNRTIWELEAEVAGRVEDMIARVLNRVRVDYAIPFGDVYGRDRSQSGDPFGPPFPGGSFKRVTDILEDVRAGRSPRWPKPVEGWENPPDPMRYFPKPTEDGGIGRDVKSGPARRD